MTRDQAVKNKPVTIRVMSSHPAGIITGPGPRGLVMVAIGRGAPQPYYPEELDPA